MAASARPRHASPALDRAIAQECTALGFCITFFFPWAGVVFSFGDKYRRPVYYNIAVIAVFCCLYTGLSIALLSDTNGFTRLFHVASEAFSAAGTDSPVWRAYLDAGGAPGGAMSFGSRLGLWLIIHGGMLTVAAWEKLVVLGPVRRWLRARYPLQGAIAITL